MSRLVLRIACCLIVITLTLPNSVHAWWSEPFNDNHQRMSKDVLSHLENLENDDGCPDMRSEFYGTVIWRATEGSRDDKTAHGGDASANDGPAAKWWNEALSQYKQLNLRGEEGAHWYIGQMVHLVEDMAVPAHAFDIKHYLNGWDVFNPDNFEHNAALNYSRSNITAGLSLIF